MSEMESESISYIFFGCEFSKLVWTKCLEDTTYKRPVCLTEAQSCKEKKFITIAKAIFYHVWNVRNNIVFNEVKKMLTKSVAS